MTIRSGTLVTLMLSVVVLNAPQALASKARLQALGQSTNGSLWIPDTRDIFLNTANVNSVGSSANFEWGGTSPSATPKGEGGGIYHTDTLNYAVQLGRVGETTQAMISAYNLGLMGTTQTLFYPQDSIDLIIGGGAGLKWGAGMHYARSVSNTGATANFPNQTAREMTFNVGLDGTRWATYLKADVLAASNTDLSGGGSVSYTGQPDGELGGKFYFNTDTAMSLVYTRRLFGFNNGTGTQGNDVDQRVRSDFYRKLFSDDKVMLFITAGLLYDEANITYQNVGANALKITTFTSPLVLGLEYKAINWLTLRGSVAQNVLIDQSKLANGLNDYDRANLESTVVAAGLSVAFGNLQIDATFTGSDTAYTPTGSTVAGSANGRLDATNLAENTSLTYSF